jgi:hypothetical protein
MYVLIFSVGVADGGLFWAPMEQTVIIPLL